MFTSAESKYKQTRGGCFLQEVVRCCDNVITGAARNPGDDNAISASDLQVRLCCTLLLPVKFATQTSACGIQYAPSSTVLKVDLPGIQRSYSVRAAAGCNLLITLTLQQPEMA